MKRKVRTITVNGKKYVWWYSICEHETAVHLSPFEDKTSVISVVFADIKDSLYGQYNEGVVVSWVGVTNPLQGGMIQYNEGITVSMRKPEYSVTLVESSTNPDEYYFTIIEPKMAGFLLTYFTEQNDLFETRKSITLNGYDLLSQMGYRVVEVKKGLTW